MNTQRVIPVLLFAVLCTTSAIAQAPAQQRGQAPQQPAVSPSVWAAPAQPQAQASSAFQSACGNQPMCYDAPDFAVAVVDFRMSMASGYKLMDATLRFVNKTNQPLILGYLDGSAVALDDQGNRYAPYGNRGLAGIGLVNGASADPKFVLQPGGAGDARWELLWRPGPQDPIGSAFDLSMTIREVTTLVGGQHTLGGEIPLRFQGLANGTTGSGVASGAASVGTAGVAGASPMLAGGTTGLPPCGPGSNAAGTMTAVAGAANSVGGQQTANATNTATNTASNAMAQLAGLKSIFGKKNAAAPATNVAGAANCIPAATSSAMPVAAGTSTAPATAGQVVNTVPTATVPGAAVAPASTAASAPGTAANAKAPANAARNAVVPATGRGVVQPNAAKATVPAPANASPATPAPTNAAPKPAVVNTAAPNAKPATQPATAAAPARKAATPPPPAKKPAPTTATPPANPTNK
jgi:hypothetical protein